MSLFGRALSLPLFLAWWTVGVPLWEAGSVVQRGFLQELAAAWVVRRAQRGAAWAAVLWFTDLVVAAALGAIALGWVAWWGLRLSVGQLVKAPLGSVGWLQGLVPRSVQGRWILIPPERYEAASRAPGIRPDPSLLGLRQAEQFWSGRRWHARLQAGEASGRPPARG